MKSALTYCFLFIWALNVWAQDIPQRGVPFLDTYLPQEYHDAGKIWDIKSTEEGILLMAADKGLMEFDGKTWKKYKGSKGFTRSICIANDSLIYTGSDLDFGKWEKNALMEYEYTSLYPFKENAAQITEEFWGVYQLRDLIIFISFNNIYVYKDDQLTKISAPHRFRGSHEVGELLYLVDEKFGVYSFDGVSLRLVLDYSIYGNSGVVGISDWGDDLLIITQNQGLYKLTNGSLESCLPKLSSYLKQDQPFSFTRISEKYFVVGTILNGIYISDNSGKIIHHINKAKGLFNNTILDLHYSEGGMLWVSMDLGFSGIHLSQNVAYVFDSRGNFGTGQTALLKDDMFFLGTNQGLYTTKWLNLKNDVDGISFNLIPTSAGQVWDLAETNEEIFCGHDHGLFTISNGQFKTISDRIGVLDVLPVDKDHLLTGTYNGIHLYKKVNGNWTFIHELDLIKGACNQILLDDEGLLWVHIPNYGVIRAELDQNLNVANRSIFPIENFSEEILFLESNPQGIQITTENFKYVYAPILNKMTKTPFTHNPNMVKHRLSSGHMPVTLNDTFQFYPVYNGFAIQNNNKSSRNRSNDNLLLRSFQAFNSDTTFTISTKRLIPYEYNSLKIDYLIPHREFVMYRYYLEGFMEKWSEWSKKSDFELINVKEGSFNLKVEAKINNEALFQSNLPIRIKPPWYRSIFAYSCYFLGLLLLLYLFSSRQSKKLDRQKYHLLKNKQEALKLQADEYRKETLVKKQEQLEKEKSALEKALRSTKIQLVKQAKADEDKQRVIQSLNNKIQAYRNSDSKNNMAWKELQRIIEGYQEKDINSFQIHMDELNQDYIQKLKSLYPTLTMYDLRLCTYIKTGLSTREIAEMMNVLPSSINVSRSRLRKKLDLEAKDDLYSFLEGIK